MQTLPMTQGAAIAGDIDWELLRLLAQTDAAMNWPDAEAGPEPTWSMPGGLDLRHPCDLDWVSRVLAAE